MIKLLQNKLTVNCTFLKTDHVEEKCRKSVGKKINLKRRIKNKNH